MGRHDDRLEKAMRCLEPPEPDLLAATRALKPVFDDDAPPPANDVVDTVRTATVLATYALAGQQFLFWHARGNITFMQQHSPWEKHLRQGVAHGHEQAARRALEVLTRCYGPQMFDRMARHETIAPEQYGCPGGGDATILSCFAFASIFGSTHHLELLLYASPDSDVGAQIQRYVRENSLVVARPQYNVDSSDAPENFAWKSVRFGARCGLEIVGALLS